MNDLIPTKYLIMRPDEPHETCTIEWPLDPGYSRLKKLLMPLLDGNHLEHVSVLADFDGGTDFKRADMFVDECGALNGLPRNEAATAIYRRNALTRAPADYDTEQLPAIYGPAILFARLVWF